MILVDDVGGLVPAFSHSPWDGVTLADFVFPFFLFIVGVSLAFAYKVVEQNSNANIIYMMLNSKDLITVYFVFFFVYSLYIC